MAPRGGERLDERVVSEGFAESKTLAQSLIRAGKVLVDDVPVDKPGTRIRSDASIRMRGVSRRFVSRGGEKLEGALASLGVRCEGRLCLDVGASTGGFTDCLLQSGARHVTAVDVGYGQLADRLRRDSRVTVLERTNARYLESAQLEHPIDLVTVDASFISATLLLPRIAQVAPQAYVLVLVKPQFEVGRGQVGKGGVVRDDALRAQTVSKVRQCGLELGYRVQGEVESALSGPKGNREIFLWLAPGSTDSGGSGVAG